MTEKTGERRRGAELEAALLKAAWDELAAVGLVSFAPNPHHRRAKLVQLTDRGAALFEEVSARWLVVADALVADIGRAEADRGAAFLRFLRGQVEALHGGIVNAPTDDPSDQKDAAA